jgi:hypothetical protein
MSRKSSIRKIKRDNSSSKNIESSLVVYLYEKGYSPISTHFTGNGLAECDVIAISKSDLIYEYEVKISRSDFKKDFIKEKHSQMIEGNFIKEGKETLYLTSNHYYFVVPKGLISVEEVPNYAGLMYFNEDLSFEIIKKSPLLHKTKADDKFIRKLAHNLTCKLVFNKVK